MAKALLIAGDGLSMLRSVEEVREYLLKEAEVKEVAVMQTTYLTFQVFQQKIVESLEAARHEPLLILFCGHGGRPCKVTKKRRMKESAGWQLSSDRRVFSYYELARTLENHPAPIYIINDCCFAFGIVRELRRAGMSAKKCGVLAASGGNRYSYGLLVRRVLGHWREFQPLLVRGRVIREKHWRSVKKSLSRRRRIADFFLRALNHMVYTISEEVFLKLASVIPIPYADRQVHALWESSGLERGRIKIDEKRWGVLFDYFFFPKEAPGEGTICVPRAEVETAGE